MTEGKREIIKGLLSEYDIQSAEDIEELEKYAAFAKPFEENEWKKKESNLKRLQERNAIISSTEASLLT